MTSELNSETTDDHVEVIDLEELLEERDQDGQAGAGASTAASSAQRQNLSQQHSTGLALPVQHRRPDEHPAAVYLARLAPGSRRTMTTALQIIAGLLTSNRLDIRTLDWSSLRYQHTAAVRALLADLYAP